MLRLPCWFVTLVYIIHKNPTSFLRFSVAGINDDGMMLDVHNYFLFHTTTSQIHQTNKSTKAVILLI